MKDFFKVGWLICVLNLTACQKDELPKAKLSAQSADIVSVTMGSDYANQLFYNLKSRTVVKFNNREAWDLAFECGTSGFHVVLNGAKVMSAQQTEHTELHEVTASESDTWKWDMPSGNLDSTAVGDWQTHDFVYIIDRGTAVSGVPLGKVKLKIQQVNSQQYTIEWGALTGSTTVSIIPKNDELNFVHFSFTTNSVVAIEPPKSTWDICFTSFTHIFDGHTPYSVVGVLTNRFETRAARLDQTDFSTISYADYLVTSFDNKINTIGYSWKTFDFETNVYVIDPHQKFIVKTSEGRIFKLRFLDFYDDFGVKGAPKMEIQELVP